jgi:hypothetical protein
MGCKCRRRVRSVAAGPDRCRTSTGNSPGSEKPNPPCQICEITGESRTDFDVSPQSTVQEEHGLHLSAEA